MDPINFENLSLEDLADKVRETEDTKEGKTFLRETCKNLDITFSNNASVASLRSKILGELVEDEIEDDPVVLPEPTKTKKKASDFTNEQLLTMDHKDTKDELLKRRIIRAKALRLVRCRLTNLDPNDADVPASLVTVYSKYTGKVSKLIPFGEENEHGYHIPQILVDELRSRKFVMRKEIKRKGSSFGVKQYKTVFVNKFNIEVLPYLTREQLESLAKDQAARGSVSSTDD